MTVFLFRPPAGVAGRYNRVGAGLTVEAGLLDPNALPGFFGAAVAVNASTGRYRGVTSTDTAALVVGVLIGAYPHQSAGTATETLGSTVVPDSLRAYDILVRGYVTVTLGNFGTNQAAKHGTVYVRINTAGAGKPIGGFEAAADSTNTVALPATTFFMGPSDSLGNCEIGFNI